jgi:hypothetical protein
MMRVKKWIAVLLCIMAFFCSLPVATVQAWPAPEPAAGVRSNDDTYATGLMNYENTDSAGLIVGISLGVYAEGNLIELNAYTGCSGVMDEVGFEDITLQQWDGYQWVDLSVWSDINYDCISNTYYYQTYVDTGYYYRFTAVHYAKDGWWIFADTERVYNETSYIWID